MRKTGLILFLLLATSGGNAQQPEVPQIPNSESEEVVYGEESIQYDTDASLTPLELSEETLDKYKDDSDFDYTEAEANETWWDRFKRWIGRIWDGFWRSLFGEGYEAIGFLAFVIKTLPYIFLAALVIFIIWLFIRLNPGSRLLKSKEQPEVFFTEEEEIIRSQDIHSLIRKAVEAKNYRLAVRYYYLLILKKLTESHIIDYEFDKTNSDYIREIDQPNLNARFQKATLLYDYIWYGSFSVTELDYEKARHIFNRLERTIPKQHE